MWAIPSGSFPAIRRQSTWSYSVHLVQVLHLSSQDTAFWEITPAKSAYGIVPGWFLAGHPVLPQRLLNHR